RAGIAVRVIDAYSVKPIDVEALQLAAAETAGLVVVEDHWPEGGLGDAVLSAFSGSQSRALPWVIKLSPRQMPGSGTAEELRSSGGIEASHIVTAVQTILAAS